MAEVFNTSNSKKAINKSKQIPLEIVSASELPTVLNDNTYLTTDNNHWYYSNGSEWVDGGVYQATGLEDNSISYDKLDDDLKNNINNGVITLNITDWEQGALAYLTGLPVTNIYMLRTKDFIELSPTIMHITCKDNYNVQIYQYDNDENYVKAYNKISNGDITIADDCLIKICIGTNDSSIVLAPKESYNNATINYDTNITTEFNTKIQTENTYLNKVIAAQLAKNLSDSPVITSSTYKLTEGSCACADDDGNIAVCFMSDSTSPHEGSGQMQSRILFFNLLDLNNITDILAFNLGETLGTYGVLTMMNQPSGYFVDGGYRVVARVMAWQNNVSTWMLATRFIDISNNYALGEITICNLYTGINTYELIVPNQETIINELGLETWANLGDVVYLPTIRYCNGKYYGNLSIGQGTHLLVSSEDLMTWTYITQPDIGYGSCEITWAPDNYGNLIGFNRAETTSSQYLLMYNTTTGVLTRKKITITATSPARPSISVRNKKAYVIASINGNTEVEGTRLPRTHKTIYAFDVDVEDIANATIIKEIGVDPYVPTVDCDLFRVGSAIYIITSTDKRGLYKTESGDGRSELGITLFNDELLS